MTAVPDPVVVVRLADIFAEQIRQGERLKTVAEQLPDHENRIRALERWRYSLPLALLAALASAGLGLAGYLHH
jgi:hypothetical protein